MRPWPPRRQDRTGPTDKRREAVAGSRFVRADLHVHTFSAPNEALRPPASVEDVARSAKAQGISIVAITDHNSAERARDAARVSDDELLVIPGIEVPTADGHLLGLFAPDAVAQLEDFARGQVLRLRNLPSGGQQSNRSIADLIDEIEARSGLAILAHIDTADGLLARANPATLSSILTRPGLVGIEITQLASATRFSDSDEDQITRERWQERVATLGRRAPLARLMSSDAHSLVEIGVDEPSRTLTRLRLDELSFHAVRMALQAHPTARCRLEIELEPTYPRAIRAGFEGGFLDGLVLELSANLTTLIGSRGSGKTTALRAIRACLEGSMSADEDGHPNMPDSTWVEFVDGLGSTRTARRNRYETSIDTSNGVSPIALPTIDLEQNFGMEFLEEDLDNPVTTFDFLSAFIDTQQFDTDEVALEADLSENGGTILATSNASTELKKLLAEQQQLNQSLKAAADAKLVDVATYARILAAETPLLDELGAEVLRMAEARLPEAPDLDELAQAFGVDLAERPAADFVEAVRAQLQLISDRVKAAEETARETLADALAPLRNVLTEWRERHDRWEAEIDVRREKLKEAGLSLQVEQLDKMRQRLRTIEADLRKLREAEKTHRTARQDRLALLQALARVRDNRHAAREAVSGELVREVNRGSTATVSVKWQRAAMLDEYGRRLGQLFNLRSPRSERLAAAISPVALAAILWRNDSTALGALRDGVEPFFTDPEAAMKNVFRCDVIFELEVLLVEDRPEVRVRYESDPPGPGRPLGDLSLGQARSVLLGFLLAAPTNSPLILDQPEDQLDGPFLADTVVGYLHAAKERRQVIVATHNPNVVVLGDAELVIPLRGESGRGQVEAVGSVDSRATLDEVVRLLEGGMPAFQERATKYGLRVEALPT